MIYKAYYLRDGQEVTLLALRTKSEEEARRRFEAVFKSTQKSSPFYQMWKASGKLIKEVKHESKHLPQSSS